MAKYISIGFVLFAVACGGSTGLEAGLSDSTDDIGGSLTEEEFAKATAADVAWNQSVAALENGASLGRDLSDAVTPGDAVSRSVALAVADTHSCTFAAARFPASCPKDSSPIGTGAVGQTAVSRPPCNPAAEFVVPAGTTNLRSAIAGHPRVCLKAGLYRVGSSLTVQTGQRVRAETGAILSGALPVSGFRLVSGKYQARITLPRAPSQVPPSSAVQCERLPNHLCELQEDVFDGPTRLSRVATTAQLVPGTFLTQRVGTTNDLLITLGAAPAHQVEVAVTDVAVDIIGDGAVIDGLVIERFASAYNSGAVLIHTSAQNAVVKNTQVRQSHAAGVKSMGDNALIDNCLLNQNGQLGVSIFQATGNTLRQSTVKDNNAAGFYRIDGAAGGLKVANTRSGAPTSVSHNLIDGNLAIGVWFDCLAHAGDIHHNVISNNWSDGIRYEISWDAKIHHNVFTGNAINAPSSPAVAGTGGSRGCASIGCGAGVTLNNADGACVYSNQFNGNLNAISLISGPRTSAFGTPPQAVGATIYENAVYLHTTVRPDGKASEVGFRFRGGGATHDPFPVSKRNVFLGNHYRLQGTALGQFSARLANRTFSQWQAGGSDPAQDVCGKTDL